MHSFNKSPVHDQQKSYLFLKCKIKRRIWFLRNLKILIFHFYLLYRRNTPRIYTVALRKSSNLIFNLFRFVGSTFSWFSIAFSWPEIFDNRFDFLRLFEFWFDKFWSLVIWCSAGLQLSSSIEEQLDFRFLEPNGRLRFLVVDEFSSSSNDELHSSSIDDLDSSSIDELELSAIDKLIDDNEEVDFRFLDPRGRPLFFGCSCSITLLGQAEKGSSPWTWNSWSIRSS